MVNKVLNYDKLKLIAYSKLVLKELENRKFNIKKETLKKFLDYMEISENYFNNLEIKPKNIYINWHNRRYLIQGYYNLQ